MLNINFYFPFSWLIISCSFVYCCLAYSFSLLEVEMGDGICYQWDSLGHSFLYINRQIQILVKAFLLFLNYHFCPLRGYSPRLPSNHLTGKKI